MPITAGYDVGGAHLKVALAEDGRTVAVRQVPCPLWQGIDRLAAAFAAAADLTSRAGAHAATMTGELCEIFPDRATGVRVIIDRLKAVEQRYPGLNRVSCGMALGTPLNVALEQLEIFAKEVMPAFKPGA